MRRTPPAAQSANAITLYLSAIASRAHGYARGALKFTPTHPRTFDRTENRFPNHITEHRSINQPHRNDPPGIEQIFAFQDTGKRRQDDVHRKKDDDKWQHIPPGPERQRQY